MNVRYNMKSKSDRKYTGFAIDANLEFQKTKEYILKGSAKGGHHSFKNLSERTGYPSSSSDSFQNNSFGSLMHETPIQSPLTFEFYSKAKQDILEIKTKFEKMKELNKKSKRVTFDNHDLNSSKVSHVLEDILHKINNCESNLKENGAIMGIDKSHKVKSIISSMQNHLYLELGKLKTQYKRVSRELKDQEKNTDNSFIDNAKFSFLSEQQPESKTIYDKNGNRIMLEEIREDEHKYDHIYKSAIELSRIMKDFEEMTVNQGCLIDRIDINISATLISTKKTNIDLVKTDTLLKTDCADRFLKLLLIMNLVAFLLVLNKFMSGHNWYGIN